MAMTSTSGIFSKPGKEMLEQRQIDLPNLEILKRIGLGSLPHLNPHGSHLIQVIPNGIGSRFFHDHTVSLLQMLKDGPGEGSSSDRIAHGCKHRPSIILSLFAKILEGVGRTRLVQFSIFFSESKRRISWVPAPISMARILMALKQWSRVRGFKFRSIMKSPESLQSCRLT